MDVSEFSATPNPVLSGKAIIEMRPLERRLDLLESLGPNEGSVLLLLGAPVNEGVFLMYPLRKGLGVMRFLHSGKG
jgi:hypothetical protein